MDSNVSASLKPSGYPGPFLTFITEDWRSFWNIWNLTFIDTENAVRSKPVPVENIH